MTSASDLTRLVPGFDFLQGLMKGGGAGLPGIGQWIAPTLEPAELQKRIDELRTVQFWLDQNSKLLGTTIQALEVQRMTLATLKGMNLQMADLADSLKLKPAAAAEPAAAARPPEAVPGTARAGAAGKASSKASVKASSKAGAARAAGSNGNAAIDPMQWWGALTQQFTELASKALHDGSAEMARNLAGAAAKKGLGAAETSIERMMAMSGKAAELAAKTGSAVANAASAAGAAGATAAGMARAATARPAAAARRRKA
ncbi:MAG: hypothetical protein JNN03_04025 [Rubrivivax sp.]|nr:hypothetical protein [Rubrivivax sp.]